jgi:3-isopropylmalate dehydratase small subunit
MDTIIGKSFFLGDDIDTDQILPGYAMSYQPEDLKNVALKGSEIKDFSEKVEVGDIIIAKDNFGCGSSREQAPLALKSTGLGVVVAKSFARIFRKNAVNIGLPVIISKDASNIIKESEEGDKFEIDISEGLIKNLRTEKVYSAEKLANTTYETLEAGGLINKVRKILIKRGEINE